MEQTQHDYARFWRRFAAFVIDGILLGILQAVVAMVFVPKIPAASHPAVPGGAFFAAMNKISLLMTLIGWAYFTVLTSMKGATLGKMVMGIKVVDAHGNPPTFVRAFLRETVGKILSAIVLCLGFLWVAFDAEKRGWHDIIAGTHAVRS